MYEISDQCKKCGLCSKRCVHGAIVGQIKEYFAIVNDRCKECGMCYEVCPFGAIAKNGILRPPDGKKKRVVKAKINQAECVGCRNCFLSCPNSVIKYEKPFLKAGHCRVQEDACKGCGCCLRMCLNDCIKVVPGIDKVADMGGR